MLIVLFYDRSKGKGSTQQSVQGNKDMKRELVQQFSLQTLFVESLPQFSRTLVQDNLQKLVLKNVQFICTRPQTFHDAHFWKRKPAVFPSNDKSSHTNSNTETKQHHNNELKNSENMSHTNIVAQNKTALAMFSWKFADAGAMLYCWNFLYLLVQASCDHRIQSHNDQVKDQMDPQKTQLLKLFTQYLLHKSLENNTIQQISHECMNPPSDWLQLAYDPVVAAPSCDNLDASPHVPSMKVFLVLSSQNSDRFYSDIKWSRLLITEIAHKAILAAENIYCSTLGAAYAAMFRDNLNLTNAEKAKEFAERQLSVGKRLGDRSLKRKARIYIGYYHIFRKEHHQAKVLLQQQLESAIMDEDEEVRKMAEAAIVRCERDHEWENQLLIQTQIQLVIEAAPGPEDENGLMHAD